MIFNYKYIEKLVNFTAEDADKDEYDWYDWGMITVVVISLIPLVTHDDCSLFWYIDVVATAVFIIDYLLRWITAPSRSTVFGEHKGWVAYAIYPFTPSALIDLLTILPIFAYVNPAVRVLRLWRASRLLRIARLFRYYEPLQTCINVFRKKARMLLVVVGFAVFYILITALIMFNLEETGCDDNHFFDTYWDAIYWAACTLTTVGYGDVYPVSAMGRVIGMVSALVGIAIIALPSSILTQGYIEVIEEEKKKREECDK